MCVFCVLVDWLRFEYGLRFADGGWGGTLAQGGTKEGEVFVFVNDYDTFKLEEPNR